MQHQQDPHIHTLGHQLLYRLCFLACCNLIYYNIWVLFFALLGMLDSVDKPLLLGRKNQVFFIISVKSLSSEILCFVQHVDRNAFTGKSVIRP